MSEMQDFCQALSEFGFPLSRMGSEHREDLKEWKLQKGAP
jgi:hypothetical protein